LEIFFGESVQSYSSKTVQFSLALTTRRLIQKGALLEKYFDVEHLTPEETEELLKMFAAYVVAHTPEKFKIKNDTE